MEKRLRRTSTQGLQNHQSENALEYVSAGDETLHFVHTSYNVNVLKKLDELRHSDTLCDVTLCVGGEEFRCHRLVLVSCSSYFMAMFTSKMAESHQEKVTIHDIDVETFRLLINYIYTAEIDINENNVTRLFAASDLLQILPIRDECVTYLERSVNKINCVDIHCLADAHSCVSLQDKSKRLILRYFKDVYEQESFLQLSHEKLCDIISSNSLCVASEEIVFDAVMQWFDKAPKDRRVYFAKVLSHVRMSLLSPYFLRYCVNSQVAIKRSAECKALIEKAQEYHSKSKESLITSQDQTLNTNERAGVVDVLIFAKIKQGDAFIHCFEPEDQLVKTHVFALPTRTISDLKFCTGDDYLYILATKLYGDSNLSYNDLWRYDPLFNRCDTITLPHAPGRGAGLAWLDGYLYMIGGYHASHADKSSAVTRYNPITDLWTPVKELDSAICDPVCVGLNGILYVLGGYNPEEHHSYTCSDALRSYDPHTNTWARLKRVRVPLKKLAAAAHDGYIYVVGKTTNRSGTVAQRYCPSTDQWTVRSQPENHYSSLGVAQVAGKLYVCGRSQYKSDDSIERYDDAANKWTVVCESEHSQKYYVAASLTLQRSMVYSNCKTASAGSSGSAAAGTSSGGGDNMSGGGDSNSEPGSEDDSISSYVSHASDSDSIDSHNNDGHIAYDSEDYDEYHSSDGNYDDGY